MKDFDNSLFAEIQLEEATSFWMVQLEISDATIWYLTNFDIDIVWDENRYESVYGFEIEPISYGGNLSVDKLRIDFDNVNLGMSSALLNNDVAGRTCKVLIGAYLAGENREIKAEVLYTGIVSDWTIDEYKATLNIVNEMIYWNKRALRQSTALCPWNFKSIECNYSGAGVVCNKTYNRCLTLGNSNNFGGFRFLPAIEEKEVWWGKTQK